MSTPLPQEGSSSSANNNQRITPQYFSHNYNPYKHHTAKGSEDETGGVESSDLYWDNEDSPPPYSPPVSSILSHGQPSSFHPSETDTIPSAPPMEDDLYPNTTTENINNNHTSFQQTPRTPLNSRNRSQSLLSSPEAHHGGYGAIPLQNDTISSNHSNSLWRWYYSLIGSPVIEEDQQQQRLILNSAGEEEQTPRGLKNTAKSASCNRLFFFIFFSSALIYFLIRVTLSLSSNKNVIFPVCPHGKAWDQLPREFSFKQSLTIRIPGNILSGGNIDIRSIEENDNKKPELGRKESTLGRVELSMIYTPAVDMYDDHVLSYSLRNGSAGTVLEIYATKDLPEDKCMYFNSVIYVPSSRIDEINIDVQNSLIQVTEEEKKLNIGNLALKTSNRAISFNSAWSGRRLDLETTNAKIELGKRIAAVDSISISTANGGITAKESIESEKTIMIYSVNGGINMEKTLKSKNVDIRTSNSPIHVFNLISDLSQLKTTNGQVNIEHGNVDVLKAESTNGPIIARVENSKFDSQVQAITSKGKMQVYMPLHHEGQFEMSYDNDGKSTIAVVDELGWARLEKFDNNRYLSGHRYDPNLNNQSSAGFVQLINSGNHCSVYLAYGTHDYNFEEKVG